MNNPSRLPPGIYFSWKPLEWVCFPLERDLEMGTNKAGSTTGKMQATRFAAELSLLIVISTGTLVWGNRVQTIAALGIAGAVIIGATFLFAMKFLEQRGTTDVTRAMGADKEAACEKAFGAIFDSLPEGNFVVHDFHPGKGNIDHILIGPKGIFTLETKSHAGEVTFDGNKLLRNGKPFEQDFIKQARANCFLVREILAQWGITTPLHEPVILFADAIVKVQGRAKGVEIVSIRYLPNLLERLPNRLSIHEAGRIYNRIGAASIL